MLTAQPHRLVSPRLASLLILSITLLLQACGAKHSDAAAVPESPGASDDSAAVMKRYDLDGGNPSTVELPKDLAEISGITYAPDGRLFGHHDETATIFQLDPATGHILSRFDLGDGKKPMRGDFEDLAIVDSTFYLVSSRGELYEFAEGVDGSHVEYLRHQTPLSAQYDIEGLCYDPATRSLLLACKEFPGDGMKGSKAIYSWSLADKRLSEKPRFLLPIEELRKSSGREIFKPSGIVRHPDSGSFLVIASHGNAIAEISADGRLIAQRHLSEKIHRQPEGIAIAPDRSLVISDEGTKHSILTRYPAGAAR